MIRNKKLATTLIALKYMNRERETLIKAQTMNYNQAFSVAYRHVLEQDAPATVLDDLSEVQKASLKKKASRLVKAIADGDLIGNLFVDSFIQAQLGIVKGYDERIKAYANGDKQRRLTGMSVLAETLPAYDLAESTRGAGALLFAQIVAETVVLHAKGGVSCLEDFTPAGLNRRMGLAVFEGHAERPGEGRGLGYAPLRKKLYHNLASCVVRANGGQGVVEAQRCAYYRVYVRTKARKLAEGMTKGRADTTARRELARTFLQDLRQQWMAELP